MDYDMPSVDYYITFDNPQTNEWIELQLYGVYDENSGYYHYGRLKTNYLDGKLTRPHKMGFAVICQNTNGDLIGSKSKVVVID